MSIKRILCIFLALATVLVFTACGGGKTEETVNEADKTAPTVQQAETDAVTKDDAATEKPAAASSESTVEKAIPGVLYRLNADGQESVITALKLVGNRVGSEEGINGKKPAAEKIRSVFELNEWIEIYPETTVENGLSATLVPHSDDPASTVTASTDLDLPKTDLEKPEEDGWAWGSLYLNPDDAPAGDYDLVLLSNNKPVAFVLIKMYNDAELENKSEAELEQLMQENESSNS